MHDNSKDEEKEPHKPTSSNGMMRYTVPMNDEENPLEIIDREEKAFLFETNSKDYSEKFVLTQYQSSGEIKTKGIFYQNMENISKRIFMEKDMISNKTYGGPKCIGVKFISFISILF